MGTRKIVGYFVNLAPCVRKSRAIVGCILLWLKPLRVRPELMLTTQPISIWTANFLLIGTWMVISSTTARLTDMTRGFQIWELGWVPSSQADVEAQANLHSSLLLSFIFPSTYRVIYLLPRVTIIPEGSNWVGSNHHFYSIHSQDSNIIYCLKGRWIGPIEPTTIWNTASLTESAKKKKISTVEFLSGKGKTLTEYSSSICILEHDRFT